MQSQTHYSPKKVQRVHSSELKYLATNFLILRIWGYAMKVVFIVIGFIFIIFFIEPYQVCRRLNILRDYSDEKTKLYPRN